MLRFLDRLSLKGRLFLALGLPLVAIVWMTTSNALDLNKKVTNLREIETLYRQVIQVGELIHQLQVERGISHGYLGSLGIDFYDALPAAREATDRQLNRLLDQLKRHTPALRKPYQEQVTIHQETFPDSDFSTFISRSGETDFSLLMHDIGVIAQRMKSLSEVRQQIDNFTISASKALDYYTQINQQLHALIARLYHHSQQGIINRKLIAYHALIKYKELAGLERAVITFALSGGAFTAELRGDLLQLWGEQRAYQAIFFRQADTRHAEQLQAILRHHADPQRAVFWQALQEHTAQDKLLSNADSAGLSLPEAKMWYAGQTGHIDQIKAVEDTLISTIVSQIRTQRKKASFEFLRYVTLSPLAVLVSLLMLYLIIRSLYLRLKMADTIFNYTHDGITVTDQNTNIIETNQAFTRITGYSRKEVRGKTPRILKSGRQDPLFYQKMWQELSAAGVWRGEIWNRHKNGEIYAELLTISAVCDKSGKVKNYIAIFSDITAQSNKHKRQLEKVATHDLLTGLPNYMLLIDRLRQVLSSVQRDHTLVAVAVINLDNFKDVNQRYGHAIGDQVLEIMAARFQAQLRNGDTLARLGGNEFAIIIKGTASTHEATAVLERVHRKTADPININDTILKITASIGVTYFPFDNVEAETLLLHARNALLHAKLNGRNRIQSFDLRNAEQQSSLARLVQRLETALENNELVLYYQPKVDMVSGELIGAEALLRWQDPERGMVPPGEFLPYLEQHPIAITIGDWVVESALAQMERWQQQGESISVSVNISAQELHHPDFMNNLRACLAAYPGIANNRLELEILESAAIGDPRHVAQVLDECRSMGVSIALDDFGTGYASLDYLKLIPATSLKIDQTFVREMQVDSGDLMIVKAIISLAEAFNFPVIAEGIESEAQGLALIELGCRQGQGFGIGRPMPADALLAWYRDWHAFPSWQKS